MKPAPKSIIMAHELTNDGGNDGGLGESSARDEGASTEGCAGAVESAGDELELVVRPRVLDGHGEHVAPSGLGCGPSQCTDTELVSAQDGSAEGGWQVVGARGRTGSASVKSTRTDCCSLPLVKQLSRFAALEGLGADEFQGAAASGGGSGRGDGGAKRSRKPFGDPVAHARFLQHYFRRVVMRRPGCWRRGGLRGLAVLRPPTVFGCKNGLLLSTAAEIQAQKERAARVLAWYSNYVRLHKRLHSSRTPTSLVLFCGEGGVSEGIRRAGGASHGQDIRVQPNFEARFGRECFSRGDSRSAHEVRRLGQRLRSVVNFASPPCKSHSTALMRGVPSEPPMIRQTRDALREAGGQWVIENVPGARGELHGAVQLRGAYFGLHVDRPRLFESNFPIHVDAALKEGGDAVRRGMCLGVRRRWRRLDPFGRPEMADCCSGNLWAVQGDKPLRCTPCECAEAMGLDDGHMSYLGMTQAIPPVYSELIFAQACMRAVEAEFGVAAITFDDYERDPDGCSRRMEHLLRGAGGAAPSQGVEFAPAVSSGDEVGVQSPPRGQGSGPRPQLSDRRGDGTPAYAAVYEGRHAGGEIEPPTDRTVRAAELRELEYSWAGGFDVGIVSPADRGSAAELDWLEGVEPLQGGNTFVAARELETRRIVGAFVSSIRADSGSRLTVESRSWGMDAWLKARGFSFVRRVRAGEPSYASADAAARLRRPFSFWAIGEAITEGGCAVDFEALERGMDPLDRTGAPSEPKTAKAARSYMPIPVDPARWDIGLPAELDQMMARQGVGIHIWEEPGFSEVPFYPFASDEALFRSIHEADRAILAGAMEYVPADQIAEVRQMSVVHPWTVVDQGGGKWRLCHDYSVGTNRQASTAPFALPSVWDVVPSVSENSRFAKYDIRDGFWHCPVAPSSRKRLVVRHPGTGRLMWASRLPFGYIDSPRLFCGLTEAVIGRCREKAAGRGIHFYVFVDDALVVGDDEALTREGMRILEEEFADRGIQWAPHKKRGPCACIEFLGLLLANVEGWRGVTLTRKRLGKLSVEIDDWLASEPVDGARESEPKPVASLLGKLVFASQVVPNGRTYMQGMLAAFKGVIVDWRRGTVEFGGQRGRLLELRAGFWRDLRWWQRHLASHSFTSFESFSRQPTGELVLAGTDASDWGTGQVLWRDGGREEHRLVFSVAEKRRSINWRELLGIVRVAKLGGERLRGKRVLVEADNMAAVGATRKLASKSEDMQELVRRLLRLSLRHGFTLRVTHTPGEKLDRPDQTSRGDALEEPRARLRRGLFERVARRVGGFSGYIGSEREHGCSREAPGGALWMHPTFSTVGTGLRRIGERLGARMEQGAPTEIAVALVPAEGGEMWNSMLRHGLRIGCFEAGSAGLEAHGARGWHACPFRRRTQVVLFPRAAGATPQRVSMAYREGIATQPGSGPAAAGYRLAGDGAGFVLDVLPGSFVYSLPGPGHAFGTLYRVCVRGPHDDAREGLIYAQEIKRASAKAAMKAAQAIGKGSFACDIDHDAAVYLPDPTELWTVDAFIKPMAGGRTFDRFCFDADSAHRMIEGLKESMPRADTHGWDLCSPEGWEEAERLAADAASYTEYVHVPTPEGLGEVVRSLDDLHLRTHPTIAGSGGALAPAEERVRGGEAEGDRSGAVMMPCQYGSIKCGGCQVAFQVGEPMQSHLGAMIHPTKECEAKHESELDRLLSEGEKECREQEVASAQAIGVAMAGASGASGGPSPPADLVVQGHAVGDYVSLSEFRQALGFTSGESAHVIKSKGPLFALFSMQAGVSGIYTDEAEALRLLKSQHGTERSRLIRVENKAAGEAFIRRCNQEATDRAGLGALDHAITLSALDENRGPLFAIFSTEVGASGVYGAKADAERWLTDDQGPSRPRMCSVDSEEMGNAFIRRCNHELALASLKASLPAEGGIAGSNTRRVHLGEKLAPARLERVEACIAGKCGMIHSAETSTPCRRGCGRMLHVETCAEMGRGYAALGNFVCPACRARDMAQDGAEPSEAARALALRTTVIELSQGREATAASYAEYTRLEEEYSTSYGTLGQALRLPRHSPEAFKNFLTWLALSAARSRSLESIVRSAGAMMSKLEIPDVTKDKSVKAHLKELLEVCGTEHEPVTAATPRMLSAMLERGGVIDARYPDSFIAAREKAQIMLEGVGGCRVGEVAGGGDEHGLLANEVAILRDPESGLVVVEAKIEHSKTGFSRYLDVAGTTEGSFIECANIMMEYWRNAGFELDRSSQAGIDVIRPNFWVVRASLLSVDSNQMAKLRHLLETSAGALRVCAKATMTKAEQRWKASGVGSQQKKYVNIGSGRYESAVLARILEGVQGLGFEARIVPGPLLLSTSGGRDSRPTSMPLAVTSVFGPTKYLLEKAYEKVNAVSPDKDLDAGHGRRIRWATHSLRRLGDTVARRDREAARVSEAEIDIYFGWHEAVLLKEMQRHYAAMSVRERMKMARITAGM